MRGVRVTRLRVGRVSTVSCGPAHVCACVEGRAWFEPTPCSERRNAAGTERGLVRVCSSEHRGLACAESCAEQQRCAVLCLCCVCAGHARPHTRILLSKHRVPSMERRGVLEGRGGRGVLISTVLQQLSAAVGLVVLCSVLSAAAARTGSGVFSVQRAADLVMFSGVSGCCSA